MTLTEILIGTAIAVTIVVGAIVFAWRTPKLKGPGHHDVRGGGDHASSDASGD